MSLAVPVREHSLHKVVSATIFLFFVFLAASSMPAWAQDHHSHDGHAGMSASMDEPLSPEEQAKLASDKRESEFNHHLAGFFVLLAGTLILAQHAFNNRFLVARYIWPVCFLLSGVFVFVFSDTELWPFGPKSWFEGITSNAEVSQHKIFAVLLLTLGFIEIARARQQLQAAWGAWVFPSFALAGSVLLLFHSHDAAMHGPDHMALMAHIQRQHFSYSAAGFGIGITKGLAEVPTRWQSVSSKLCPALMILLGVLLMLYTE